MPQGTITLPSGDKLLTSTETLPGGALVHREEIVLSGTISDTLVLPTTSQPSAGVYALPTWIVAMPTQTIDAAIYAMNAALSNSIGISGQLDDVSTTTATEDRMAPPRITPQRALHVNLRGQDGKEVGTAGTPLQVGIAASVNIGAVAGTVQVAFTPAASQNVSLVNVGFAGTPLVTNIGAVAGTVQVAFTPSASQNVSLVNVGFAGTPLRIDPTGTTPQPVTFSGTVSMADSARYSEQLTQTTRLTTIDTDVLATTAAILGTPAVKFASAQSVSISNTPNVTVPGTPAVTVFGTPSVNVASHPPISFASAQPISTIAGTVNVAFTPAASQNVNLQNVGFAGTPLVTNIGAVAGTVQVSFAPAASQNVNLLNVGFAGTPLRVDPTGTTTQPVSFSGTVSMADSARYSEQLTQTTRLTTIDTDVLAVTAAVLGTPAVKFASAQQVTISGVPTVSVPGTPAVTVFGTPSVNVASHPAISFASAQPISTVAGTVSVTFPSAQSVTVTNAPNVVVPGTPAVSIFGTPSVNVAAHPPVTFASAQPISTVAGTVSVTFPSAQSVSVTNSPNVVVPGTPAVSIFGTPSVYVASHPPITFASAQPISTIAGTVSVSFTPAASQNVSLVNVGFAGTPLFTNIGAVAGTVQVAFTPSASQNVNLVNVGFAGTPLTTNIGAVAGTVQVSFAPAASQNVNLMNVGFAGTPLVTNIGAVIGTISQGLVARSTDPTAVANGALTLEIGDTLGKQVVLHGATHDMAVSGTANYTTTTAGDILSGQAGVRFAIMSILVTNAHASTSSKVEIRDGDKVKISGYAGAVGGGFAHHGGAYPLFVATAGSSVAGRAVTSGADVDVSISGYKITN